MALPPLRLRCQRHTRNSFLHLSQHSVFPRRLCGSAGEDEPFTLQSNQVLSESVSAPAADPVEQLYRELEANVREYRPKDDLSALEKAFRFASKYHEGQTRNSGEAYMAHPVMVAHILASMRMDLIAMQTGLLHDVV